ncbi:MAG: hypothetical protein J5I94_23410 [Phaeodactylibacter sp.]|nr:hypothetical protein [Phaeodactylibacter sp.]
MSWNSFLLELSFGLPSLLTQQVRLRFSGFEDRLRVDGMQTKAAIAPIADRGSTVTAETGPDAHLLKSQKQ